MSLYPATVRSYDKTSHRARVEIPGFTDGSDVFPEAEILYPAGDLYNDTEILIRVGDIVYVDFIVDGDMRTPIIVGYRNPRTGCLSGVRRIRQKVIEIIADQKILLKAPSLVAENNSFVNTGTATVQKAVTMQQTATVNGSSVLKGSVAMQSGASISGNLKSNGKDVGSSHTHSCPDGTTSPPL